MRERIERIDRENTLIAGGYGFLTGGTSFFYKLARETRREKAKQENNITTKLKDSGEAILISTLFATLLKGAVTRTKDGLRSGFISGFIAACCGTLVYEIPTAYREIRKAFRR